MNKPHHLFIGIDRSDEVLDIHILDAAGEHVGRSRLSSAPEALLPWVLQLKDCLPEGATLALCIEQPCINLITFFSRFEHLVIYPVNPVTLKKYRESFILSRAKDDKKDALHLAQLIHERHTRLQPWKPADPVAAKLAILSEKRRQLVDLRTSMTNRLTQLLKDYYPQALQLTGKHLHAPLACDFLLKWPTLQALKKSRPQTITRFYILHASRRPELIAERLELIKASVALSEDPAILEPYAALTVALAKQLRQLDSTIKHFDKLIKDTASRHEDIAIFRSMPGAGDNFSARLLAFFGSDRSRYPDAASVQRHSGVAPVTKQSGKTRFVHRRYACPKFWRQTFVEWAAQTVIKSLWAKAYYQQQKDKGHKHQSILRSLAFKWIRILFRCWKNSTIYDEAAYLQSLNKSSSPLLKHIALVEKTHPKLCAKS